MYAWTEKLTKTHDNVEPSERWKLILNPDILEKYKFFIFYEMVRKKVLWTFFKLNVEILQSALFLQYSMCLTFTAGMPPEGDASLQLRANGLNHIFLQTENGYIHDLPVLGQHLTQLFGANDKYLPCVHKSYVFTPIGHNVQKLLHLTVMHQTWSQNSKPVLCWFANCLVVCGTYKDRTAYWNSLLVLGYSAPLQDQTYWLRWNMNLRGDTEGL